MICQLLTYHKTYRKVWRRCGTARRRRLRVRSLTYTRPAFERKGQIVRLNKIATAAVAGLMVLPLAACGGSTSTSSGTASNKANAGVNLTYCASNQGTSLDNDKQVLTPELAKFTKQTGIKVNLEVVPWADLLNRVLAATTSGKGPDVVNIGNTWSSSVQATGAFLPFDDATPVANMLPARNRDLPPIAVSVASSN